MVNMLLSQVVNGIVLGFLYVLMSIGLTVIFGLLGIVNFAHGAFFTLGAYISLTLIREFGWPAAILGPLILGALAMLVEMLLFRRSNSKDTLITLVITYGLALLIEALIRVIWGSMGRPLGPPSFLQGYVEYGAILITTYRLAVIVVVLILLLSLWLFLKYTPFGRILRAGSHDAEMVGLLGINLPLVLTGAFGLGATLTGAAGVLASPLWSVNPNMGSAALVSSFVTVTVGGLGSYAGAIVAGLAVGITTALTIQFWPNASTASMYVLMTVVLLLRPRGLFGTR